MSYGVSMKEAVETAEPLSQHDIAQLGATLVVAPHPDDESLACGGLIFLLRTAGHPVWVLFVSDGSQSHPGSKKYPAAARVKLRESEALQALGFLQVPSDKALFLRLPDAALPFPGTNGFDEAVNIIQTQLGSIRPNTLVLPWRRDPHPDHRASWHLVQAAVKKSGAVPTQLEYPLWLWERGAESDLPLPEEVNFYSIDIFSALPAKQRAIAAHRSQISNLIDDDPQGFQLSPAMLAHFDTPCEIFLKVNKNIPP